LALSFLRKEKKKIQRKGAAATKKKWDQRGLRREVSRAKKILLKEKTKIDNTSAASKTTTRTLGVSDSYKKILPKTKEKHPRKGLKKWEQVRKRRT